MSQLAAASVRRIGTRVPKQNRDRQAGFHIYGTRGEAGNGSFLGYTRVERNFRTCVKMRDKVTYEGVNRKATQTNL